MRSKILLTVVLSLLFLGNIQSSFAQDTQVIEYGGLERSYIVDLPTDYDEEIASPLLIALHGYGSNGSNLEQHTQIAEIASDAGYISVFPDGYQTGWSYLPEDEMLLGDSWTDDAGFLTALIDQLIEDYNVNTRRIFIVGFSNGALMALRMGCELDERLAGVAAVAATYSFELAVHCANTAPIPTVLVWGTNDEAFPPAGTFWLAADGTIRSSFSLNQTRSFLLTRYQCQEPATPELVQTDNSPYPVQREIYTGCLSGVPAIFYLIVGEGHTWPASSHIMLLDGETEGSIEMTFFELFNNIQRPE